MSERLNGQEYHQGELFPLADTPLHPNLEKIKPGNSYVVFSYLIKGFGSTIHANYDHELSIDEQVAAVDENYAIYENWLNRIAEDPEVLWDALKEPFT